jgi:predicted phosphatase
MISFEERIARIQNQSKIVYLDDMTIHKVEAVTKIGEHVFVTTSGGMMFQDVDIFTLDEIYAAETAINKLKKEYKIK